MDSDEQLHWLALARLPGCTAAIRRRLQGLRQNPLEILELDDSSWRQCGAGAPLLRARNRWHSNRGAAELRRLAEADNQALLSEQAFLLPLGCPGYPPLLTEIHDPPPLLYCAGQAQTLQRPQLAIVGSRRCAASSRRIAAEFAAALVDCGFSVCSGLALGIDAAAHAGALQAGGPTAAVMATGIDRCYPPRHRELAGQIRAQGLLLTEFAPGTMPRPERFPMRNRIISGLSTGVLVVEAGLRSGSLITARLALEQNREVFAVPHSIHFPGAAGCHQLLRQGAGLAVDIGDIVGEVASLCRAQLPPQASKPALKPGLALVYAQLDYEPLGVDQLVLMGAGDTATIVAALLELQLQGLVENRDGLYMRK